MNAVSAGPPPDGQGVSKLRRRWLRLAPLRSGAPHLESKP